MLLPVPMEGLGSCPALPIGLENTMHFPIRSICDQDLARFGGPLLSPQHDNPYWMVKRREADAFGEVPLGRATDRDLTAAGWTQIGDNPVAEEAFLSVDTNLAVRLQVTD